MKRGAAALVALSLALPHARAAAVAATDCSKPQYATLYTQVVKEIGLCQERVGFVPENPLTDEQRGKLCDKCSTLARATLGRRFGDCTVLDKASGATVRLQAKMEMIFVCTNVAPLSSSGSGLGGIDNLSPASTNNTQPRTNSSLTSNYNSADSRDDESGVTANRRSASMGTGTIAGIVAACVIVAVAFACVVQWRRRRRRGESALPKSPHTLVLTGASVQHRNALTPVLESAAYSLNTDGDGSSSSRSKEDSHAPPERTPPPVEDEDASELWTDEVIVAARVSREKVLSETLLSRGGFGEVYRGTYNGQVVAIKTLLPEAKKSLKQINAFLSEIRLMATLEHERIVTFIGVAWDSLNDLCVVTEYMEGGDLRGLLTQYENDRRPRGFDHDKVKIAFHVAHALTYLHSLQPVVLHRDLKSRNILLDKHLNAKLTDFGVSRESSYRTMTAGVGTSLWMAPEVMLGERYDEKADVFSFGIVLSELDSHALPYAMAKQPEWSGPLPDTAILQMVSLGRLQVRFSPKAHRAIVALAQACVSIDPTQRPTAADVLCKLHRVLQRMAPPERGVESEVSR